MTFALALAAGLAIVAVLTLFTLLARRHRHRVPPARPRATFREAIDQAGEEVDRTVFPPRRSGPGLRT